MRFAISTHGGWRRLAQWLRRHLERLASYGHEIDMLLRADDRVLKDIGLTRSDAQAVARCHVMAKAAVARRNEAIAAASQRRRSAPIPTGPGGRLIK